MKSIVKGNDFSMHIPVMKIVDGDKRPFPLPACTDIVVNVVSVYKRTSLSFTIDAKEDNVLIARVEGDMLSAGTYALEVRGKIFGNDWRSNEYEQFRIVDNNASASTVFDGELIDGEDSVEMDTAIVFLPPNAELGGLLEDVGNALDRVNNTISDVEERTTTAINSAKEATALAESAANNAEKEAKRAQNIADHPNRVSEDGYWEVWNEAIGDYSKTSVYARGGCDYPTFYVDFDDMSLNVVVGQETDNERFFVDEDGCLCVKHNM